MRVEGRLVVTNNVIKHDIRHDPTGSGHDRWSCYANQSGCNGKAVIRYDYHTDLDWESLVIDFKAQHRDGNTVLM